MKDILDAMSSIVDRAYALESMLRILSLAADGEQIRTRGFADCGGGAVLDVAVEMAGEIVQQLEVAELAARRVTA
jgi:hypothetical protein